MQFHYDQATDVFTIALDTERPRQGRDQPLPFGEARADLAADGTVLTLHFAAASRHYPLAALLRHAAGYDTRMSLAAAAPLSGVSAQALRKACERGRLKGQKIGRDWSVTNEALSDYLLSRVHAGAQRQGD